MKDSIAKKIADATGCRYKLALENGKGYLTIFPRINDATRISEHTYDELTESGARISQYFMTNISPDTMSCYFYVYDMNNETITSINL